MGKSVVLAFFSVLIVMAMGLAYWWAAMRGLPSGKRWLAVLGGFFVAYLPVFGDQIPTRVMHQRACEREAGFRIHKPLAQWKAENPGVFETLVPYGDGRTEKGVALLNDRFSWAVYNEGPYWANLWQHVHELLDRKSGNVMARYTDFSTGNGTIGGKPPLRFWLQVDHCDGGEANYATFLEIKRRFQGSPASK